jgi:ribosomal protein S21
MQVKIRRNETSENLIKRFARKVKKGKIIEGYLDRRYYKKPSEKRREKQLHRLLEIEKLRQKEKKDLDG